MSVLPLRKDADEVKERKRYSECVICFSTRVNRDVRVQIGH